MAEITYYYDSATTGWDDPENLVDNDLGTYATQDRDSWAIIADGNTCPGTDLGTISKIEVRVYGYGDGDDQIDIRPRFDTLWGGYHDTTPGVNPAWGSYIEITTDPNAPSPWNWSDLQTVDVQLTYDKVSKGNVMHAAKVEIRVTYEPSGPPSYYHGLNVQGEGELALCDVGNHPLRIRKGGTTYGIELVETNDPNASRVRMKTPAGIKAIRKYT